MSKKIRQFKFQNQSGAVLIVGLVMVLLISIVALSGIRGTNLQEVMAGNLRNKTITFQAAESALVTGEAVVDYRVAAPECTNAPVTCYRPLESQLAKDSVVYLDGNDFEAKSREANIDLSAAGIGDKPSFIIEELSPFIPMDGSDLTFGGSGGLVKIVPYRIIARGTGMGRDSESSVIVLSTYNRFAAE